MSVKDRSTALVMIALMFTFFLFACGGGGGGGDVAYDGSTDPAVADSTTAAVLAEYGMGMIQAGFPLAQPFVAPPPGLRNASLSAQPLAWGAETTVTVPVPSEAVIEGSEYSEGGTGTAELNGTMTLYLGAESAESDTWYVIQGELEGSIVFDDFSTEEGPSMTGTVTVPSGTFFMAGSGIFSISEGTFPDDPGLPVWTEVEMTFSNLTVSEGSESWSLGEGDWFLENEPGSGASLDIYSMTVEYDSSTYKLEDTKVTVEFSSEPASLPAEPLAPAPVSQTHINVSGTGEAENGTFYHPELGRIYFSGDIYETDPPDDITDGHLEFYDAAADGDTLFDVYFGYDDGSNLYAPATVYNIFMSTEKYSERGYFIDGTFIQSDLAPWLN
jgi:hypothetical protein